MLTSENGKPTTASRNVYNFIHVAMVKIVCDIDRIIYQVVVVVLLRRKKSFYHCLYK